MRRKHEKLVREISRQVRLFYSKNIPFRIYHGSTNSTRKTEFDRDKMVNVSLLNRVLSIDKKSKTALVEPNIPMDKLVEATIKVGLIPPVVMEFPGITVGGALQGGAGESSSYKWGTFNRTINWFEIILGNGEFIRASKKLHTDLFWGAAGSYGSIGVVTTAEIQLIPSHKYVELEYFPVKSYEVAIKVLKQKMGLRPDFIDGIMFSKNTGVIMVGNFSDTSKTRSQSFSRSYDPWFYLHAEKIASKRKRTVETILTKDYLFRYDRGAFWMGKFAFQEFKVPFNRFTRFLLDPLLRTRRMYNALQASGASQEYIVQDLALPENNAIEFMKYVDKSFGIYPIWICPLLRDDKSPFLSSNLDTQLVINIGVWGKFKGNYSEFVKANRDLENEMERLGGKKWLYAHVYYDEKTFWRIYGGKKRYENLRIKYKGEKLPTVFEKVKVTKKYNVNTKKGVLFALLGINGIRLK